MISNIAPAVINHQIAQIAALVTAITQATAKAQLVVAAIAPTLKPSQSANLAYLLSSQIRFASSANPHIVFM